MTYVTLYRKYRPKTFADVIGQEHVRQTLINALKANKTSHAYLFAGPRGTGKTSIAKILAKALNCQNSHQPSAISHQEKPKESPNSKPQTLNQVEPCNECSSCKDVDNNSSVDVLEIDAASNRGIDEIRNLRERVHFAPGVGSKKVFIIDEVHMLTTEAFNALLKMVEEPPEHAVFILATTEAHKVIPTIISRCQRFDFRRISVDDIVARLKYIADQEKITVDESTLAVIARQAQGSVRDSIGLLDQLASFADNKITPDTLTQVLNLTESELLFEITDLIINKDTLGCLKFIDQLMNRGYDLRQFSAELIQHFRSITIVLAADEPAEIIHTTTENLSRIKSQAKGFQIFEAIKVIDLLSDVYRQMRFSSDTRLLLEIALIKLAKLESDFSLEGLLYRVEELEKIVQSGHNTVASEIATAQQVEPRDDENGLSLRGAKRRGNPESEDKDKIHRIWPVVMQQIKKESIPLYSLMLECHPKNEGQKLVLVFNKTADFHLKEVSKNSKVIEKALKDVVGHDYTLDFVMDESQPQQDHDKDQNLSADKVIEMMKDNFGAQIIEKTILTDEKEDS